MQNSFLYISADMVQAASPEWSEHKKARRPRTLEAEPQARNGAARAGKKPPRDANSLSSILSFPCGLRDPCAASSTWPRLGPTSPGTWRIAPLTPRARPPAARSPPKTEARPTPPPSTKARSAGPRHAAAGAARARARLDRRATACLDRPCTPPLMQPSARPGPPHCRARVNAHSPHRSPRRAI